jgi:hypothetical protein
MNKNDDDQSSRSDPSGDSGPEGHASKAPVDPPSARTDDDGRTPEAEWRWFGCAGHLIVARWCQFHLCTQVGEFLVSTVGEYVPDETVREILASTRGVVLEGQGDARLADYMRKLGYEEIGYGRTYETLVFRTTGDVCHAPDCACGLPTVDYRELDGRGYTSAGAATLGHLDMCRQFATGAPVRADARITDVDDARPVDAEGPGGGDREGSSSSSWTEADRQRALMQPEDLDE